jgi:hypothetical protein
LVPYRLGSQRRRRDRVVVEDFLLFVTAGLAVFAFMAGCLLVFRRVNPAWARSVWHGERVLFVLGGLVWVLFFAAASAMSDVHGRGVFVPEFFAALGLSLGLPYMLCRALALRLMRPAPPPSMNDSSSVPLVKQPSP